MALFDSFNQLHQAQRSTTRRRFLWGAGCAALAYLGFRKWRFRARPVVNRLTRFVSPTKEFYTVAYDESFRPRLSVDDWRLTLADLDGKAQQFTFADIRQLPRQTVYKTLVCIGNEIGGPFINNAEWTVTPLAPLILQAVGNHPHAGLRVMFRALDGFYSSVPVEVALNSLAYLAYEMNGAELSEQHGFPLRVFLPGKYGIKQPRWLERIEIVKNPWWKGYWEARGFSDDSSIHAQARIDYAMPQKDQSWIFTGVALAGTTAVGQVELSFDEGKSWQFATLTSEALPDVWATWEFRYPYSIRNEMMVMARVTDANGQRQIESDASGFPAGSTGIHRVLVQPRQA